MFNKTNKAENRKARHLRVRKNVSGTAARPRLCVFKSAKNMYAQIIDDENRVTLTSASTIDKSIDLQGEYAGNKAAAKKVGELIAQRALEKGIEEVVFDRAGYLYHGRVKELAEGAREKGLKF
ncbi:50S ribosomal protein L18 [Criibacterium bergeronii]|uniref:Large ribosomal subunit protein uL18 n=1 Tax=Criibacterium bergeronii TaxID=1871336 RepID=A0A371IMQ7_9FIRM|nr:50S ribosomal protein L18 [Criibacterium bergeronii]MBS6063894.1 50S ribosomal protein L18 [Peptostreptococcaceae bacterium]RDY21768.1 50S ribosomal protein L18 [Criibacterium bergeronii]TRW26015.1 50S ribosomal protein L18 [Criibacterium bergeronii]